MAVTLYDDALLQKLQKWTAGTEMHLTGINESKRLFETILDRKDDKPIELPLIALSRNGGYVILNKNKTPLTYSGSTLVKGQQRSARLNCIPIGIAYQLDIYARHLKEADEYARNLVFNIINYPKLTIEIPYEGMGLKHDANIRLVSDVEDNSDIPERLISGQFSRFTLGLEIDDAYLWDVRVKDNLRLVEGQVKVTDVIDNTEHIDTELIFEMQNLE